MLDEPAEVGRRWTHWVVTAMVISGCSRELASSTTASFTTTPTIPGCTQDPTFSLGGAALFPLVVNALADAGLEFPSLTLQRERDEAGNVTEPIELIAHPVGRTTNQQFALDEPPPAGRYGLRVTSTEGRTTRRPAALTFLPPPEILGLSQSFACRQGASYLKLQVAHFAPERSVSINGQHQFPESVVQLHEPPSRGRPGNLRRAHGRAQRPGTAEQPDARAGRRRSVRQPAAHGGVAPHAQRQRHHARRRVPRVGDAGDRHQGRGLPVRRRRHAQRGTGPRHPRVDANHPSLSVPPRRPGALGAWQVLPTRLSVPREGPGVAWAVDPLDATTAHLYVAGGRSGPNTVQDSIEVLPITLGAGGAQNPAAAFVTSATRLTEARWMFGASPASQPTSSNLPAGATWLYLLSGLGTGGGVSSVCEASEVLAGGALGPPGPLSPLGRTSVGHLLIDNRVRVFGGTPLPSTLVSRAELCGPGTSGCGAMIQAPSLSPWSTPASEVMGLARVDTGVARAGAQVCVVGGAFAAPTGTLLDTTVVEYRTW